MNNNNNNTKMNNFKKITNLELYSNKFDEDTLINNINYLSPSSILKTQHNLSNEFISKYILNKEYFIFREDYEITINDIVNKYPKFILIKN
jgi:hypothetical protein